jgi:uncharacterized protein DUF6998
LTRRPDDAASTSAELPTAALEAASTLAHRHSLAAESAPGLLALYSAIVEELHGRGVVRSTNNPVGDYAEYLTARAFGLSLVGNSSIGYDAISVDGIRFQVKSRRLTARNRSRQLSFFRGLQLPADPFDLLVAVLFNEDFTVQRAALVPVDVVREHAVRVEYVNAWRLILRDSVWAIDGVEDVTDRIAAAASSAAPLPRLAQEQSRPPDEHAASASPRPAAAGPRQLKQKADPLEVRAYFASTGLSRRELGEIVGTGVGVIATVQNPNGDRWSVDSFERARALVEAHLAKTRTGRQAADGPERRRQAE